MSNWKLAIIVYAISLAACVQTAAHRYIELLDGIPIDNETIADDIRVSFDGNDQLVVTKDSKAVNLSARTPSVLHVSPAGDVIVLNFGDGSGQVYDIAVYRLIDGAEVDVREFRSTAQKYARSNGCQAAPDAASIVFQKWLPNDEIEVTTEDFSRSADCSSLNRTWRIALP